MSYPVCPSHVVVTYTNDPASGRFLKDPAIITFSKIPEWLKVSRTWDAARKAVGAELMIDGPTRNKVRTMHTGLIPTGIEQWFVGDHTDVFAGRTCRNTVVFYFSPDARRLIVFYFTGLQKYSIEERVKFARTMIPSLVPKIPNDEGHRSAPRLSSMPHRGDAACGTA